MPKTVKMLDVSTRHLPPTVLQNLNSYPGVIADRRDYGWLLFVPRDDLDSYLDEYAEIPDDSDDDEVLDECATIPDEIVALWRYAVAADCHYVLLDRDSEIDPDLPTFPW